MFSKNTDDWKTPSWIYNQFINNGCIDLFPYKSDHNQYDLDYVEQKLFINPPFSQMADVIDYVIELSKKGNNIFLLIPSRTDTKYFHRLISSVKYVSIFFIEGRLKYNDGNNAPFPSIIININGHFGLNRAFYLLKQDEISKIIF